jgi:biopolymer transport protein ExbD
MAIQFASRRTSRRVSLTPLIDVVFILLVFFMLETTFLTEGGVKVAAADAGGVASLQGQRVTLELLDMNHVWVDGKRVAYAEWTTVLETVVLPTDEYAVEIRTADPVSVQRVVDVLDRLSALGYVHVTVGETRGFGA